MLIFPLLRNIYNEFFKRKLHKFNGLQQPIVYIRIEGLVFKEMTIY